jgi:hypothetical protein
LVNDARELISNAEVVIVSNKEEEFVQILKNIDGEKNIVDLIRIDEELVGKQNYHGINW